MPAARLSSLGRLLLQLADVAALPASSPTPEERPPPGAAPGASSTPTLGPHQGSSTAGGSSGNSTALAFGIIALFLAAGVIIFRLYFRGSCCALMAPLRREERRASRPRPQKAAAKPYPPPVVVVMPDQQLQCAVLDSGLQPRGEPEECGVGLAEQQSPAPPPRPWGTDELLYVPKAQPQPAVPLWTVHHCCGFDSGRWRGSCRAEADQGAAQRSSTAAGTAAAAADAVARTLEPAPAAEEVAAGSARAAGEARTQGGLATARRAEEVV